MAASLVISWDDYEVTGTWGDFTDRGLFTNHDPVNGRTLYGAEVEVSLLDKISEIEAVSGARLRKKIASDMEKIRKVLTNYFRVRKYRR